MSHNSSEKNIYTGDWSTPDGMLELLRDIDIGYSAKIHISDIKSALSRDFGENCSRSQAYEFFRSRGFEMTEMGDGAIVIKRIK